MILGTAVSLLDCKEFASFRCQPIIWADLEVPGSSLIKCWLKIYFLPLLFSLSCYLSVVHPKANSLTMTIHLYPHTVRNSTILGTSGGQVVRMISSSLRGPEFEFCSHQFYFYENLPAHKAQSGGNRTLHGSTYPT